MASRARCVAVLWLALTAAAPAPSTPPASIVLDDIYRFTPAASASPTAGRPTTVRSARTRATSGPRRGAAARLTNTPAASESQPRFSDDGRRIAYPSDAGAGARDGDPHAQKPADDEDTRRWRMPAGGGRATRLTSLAGGIPGYGLSPDGRSAVVVAEVGRDVGRTGGTPPPIEIDRFHFEEDMRGYFDRRARSPAPVLVARRPLDRVRRQGRVRRRPHARLGHLYR